MGFDVGRGGGANEGLAHQSLSATLAGLHRLGRTDCAPLIRDRVEKGGISRWERVALPRVFWLPS